MDAFIVTAIAAIVVAVIAAAWWHHRLGRRTRKIDSPPVEQRRNADFRTKRKLETALQELRELREALPAADRVRIERRKSGSVGLQGREERRKGRAPR
jgi:hypothetical protein